MRYSRSSCILYKTPDTGYVHHLLFSFSTATTFGFINKFCKKYTSQNNSIFISIYLNYLAPNGLHSITSPGLSPGSPAARMLQAPPTSAFSVTMAIIAIATAISNVPQHDGNLYKAATWQVYANSQ